MDFHWEVNGKKYEFSMPGGGFVSFTKLMEVIGVTGREENDNSGADSENEASEEDIQKITALTLSGVEVSSETKAFVADVEKVEFSDPDLVWVGKAADDSTVGALKEANKLKVDYSAELTEEQIKTETARCLKCGASIVDENKCIGCGVCTTKCEFDAIKLYREHPECSKMTPSEDKLKYVLPNGLKQRIKVAFKHR